MDRANWLYVNVEHTVVNRSRGLGGEFGREPWSSGYFLVTHGQDDRRDSVPA